MPYGKPIAGVCAATALFVCGVAGFPAPPATVPPSSAVLSLPGAIATGSTGGAPVAPGGSITLNGTGFEGNASITIAVYSTPRVLDHVVADSDGDVSATVTLPKDLSGHHTLTAIGNGPDGTARALTAVLDISAAPIAQKPANNKASAVAGPLASTGFATLSWTLGGLALLLGGFVLVRSTVFRRRLLPARK